MVETRAKKGGLGLLNAGEGRCGPRTHMEEGRRGERIQRGGEVLAMKTTEAGKILRGKVVGIE